ncbi:MAG: hypothetical protein O9345_21915 [Burkholderiaceae bacterium]|jgi:hypothetical protein|nr:hypothetical protein [Burkholderiales bacterium]MCZ8103472.1 hypothetical protein [Burkholderiales bacterium]MCZ8340775.1 hypothetical protein [Burkholderiaceae bacterium]
MNPLVDDNLGNVRLEEADAGLEPTRSVRYSRVGVISDDGFHADGEPFPAIRRCGVPQVARYRHPPWRNRSPRACAQANPALDAGIAAVHADSGRTHGPPRVRRTLRDGGIHVVRGGPAPTSSAGSTASRTSFGCMARSAIARRCNLNGSSRLHQSVYAESR